MDFQQFRQLSNELDANPSYALALYVQAWHETGGFTSNLCQERNNMFGMKLASLRKQNIVGMDSAKHVYYPSKAESLRDRIALDKQNRTFPPANYEDIQRYFKEVQRKGYAEDKNYLVKLDSVFAQLTKDISINDGNTVQMASFGVGGILLLAGVAYYLLKR